MEKVYLSSINDELLFDDLEECVEFIVDNSENPIGKHISVFVKVQPTYEDLLDIDHLSRLAQEESYTMPRGLTREQRREYAEDYASELHYCKETKEQLFNLVLNWMNSNIDQPTFYTAGKLLEEVEVTEVLCKSLNIELN